MAPQHRSALSAYFAQTRAKLADARRVLVHRGPSQIQFWLIALVIGVLAGFAALFFRKGIELLQATLYGTEDVQHLHSFAQSLPWYWVLMIPVLGVFSGMVLLNEQPGIYEFSALILVVFAVFFVVIPKRHA